MKLQIILHNDIIIGINGHKQTLYLLNDICRSAGIRNVPNASKKINQDYKYSVHLGTDEGNPWSLFIDRQGLHQLYKATRNQAVKDKLWAIYSNTGYAQCCRLLYYANSYNLHLPAWVSRNAGIVPEVEQCVSQ